MHVAETFFQARNRFPVCREAEVTRLDDAGMHRTDRNLVKPLTLDRQKFIVRRITQRGRNSFAEWRRQSPSAVIEPRTRIGTSFRLDAVEIADRAFQPNRRRMDLPDRWEGPFGYGERNDRGRIEIWRTQGKMHLIAVAPERKQIGLAGLQRETDLRPCRFINLIARPRLLDRQPSGRCQYVRGGVTIHVVYPSSAATLRNQRMTGSGSQSPATKTRAR